METQQQETPDESWAGTEEQQQRMAQLEELMGLTGRVGRRREARRGADKEIDTPARESSVQLWAPTPRDRTEERDIGTTKEEEDEEGNDEDETAEKKRSEQVHHPGKLSR